MSEHVYIFGQPTIRINIKTVNEGLKLMKLLQNIKLSVDNIRALSHCKDETINKKLVGISCYTF